MFSFHPFLWYLFRFLFSFSFFLFSGAQNLIFWPQWFHDFLKTFPTTFLKKKVNLFQPSRGEGEERFTPWKSLFFPPFFHVFHFFIFPIFRFFDFLKIVFRLFSSFF